MRTLFCSVLMLLGVNAQQQSVFRYPVSREKFPRDERGELVIDASTIAFKSENGKTSIEIALLDVHEADVSNPRTIRVETYDNLKRKLMGRRSYTFELQKGQHGADLARFLAAHLKRPLVGFQESVARGAVYEIPAYHRHRFGGCHGKLRFDESGIQFVSGRVDDSRTWSYSEIETIGSMNDFHFRVSALAETYNFDLKERLPSAAYELAFKSVAKIAAPSGFSH